MSATICTMEKEFQHFRVGETGSPQKLAETKDKQDHRKATKRVDYLKWEEYFMCTAKLTSMRSKDPSCQVGCVIVDDQNHIVAAGYNGFPNGCSDDELPWGKGNDNALDNKYAYVVHAEVNAILNKNNERLEKCTLYTTTFPCNECAKVIIQSRIKEVVYLEDRTTTSYMASRRLFDMAKVNYRQFSMDKSNITVTLTNP